MRTKYTILHETTLAVLHELERLDTASMIAARARGTIEALESFAEPVVSGSLIRKQTDQEQGDKAAALYAEGKTLLEVATEMGRSPSWVCRRLDECGIPRRPQGQRRNVLPAERKRADLIRQRREDGKTLQEIGDELGVTRERVRQLCEKHGIPSERKIAVKSAEHNKAVEMYREGTSISRIADELGASIAVIRRYLREEGFELASEKRGHTPEVMAKAREAGRLYTAGERVQDIADKLGVPSPVVYRYLSYVGVKPSRGYGFRAGGNEAARPRADA